jgi:Helix-hairpin-helix motif
VNPVAQDKKSREAALASLDDKGGPSAEDPVVAARRRVFLLLETHREELGVQVRRRVRVQRRYEDLCLIKMVTRLERDYLTQPLPGAGASPGVVRSAYGIADWAKPWGQTFLLQFQADLNVFDTKLKSSRRWLSAATQGRAEALAAERFASITAGMATDLKAAGFAPPEWPSLRHRPRRAPARRAARARRGESKPGPRGWRGAPGEGTEGKLNLNQVSYADLRSLRLSVTQSHRLLAYRKRIGGYDSIEQLDEVPGFTAADRERLKRGLTL